MKAFYLIVVVVLLSQFERSKAATAFFPPDYQLARDAVKIAVEMMNKANNHTGCIIVFVTDFGGTLQANFFLTITESLLSCQHAHVKHRYYH